MRIRQKKGFTEGNGHRAITGDIRPVCSPWPELLSGAQQDSPRLGLKGNRNCILRNSGKSKGSKEWWENRPGENEKLQG